MSDAKIVTPETKAARPTWKPAGKVHAGEQPFSYPLKREFVEPDWRRLPGYKNVTQEEWETALWQRRHTVKNLKELKAVFGDLIPDSLMASVERDIKERATMSILIPPHMLNTMDDKDLWNDPVRRYMLPAFDDRHPEWPSHPKASRDSLHEADMWAVEGLDASLSHQGAGGDALHLPAILRTLHAHGPGRQRRAAGGEAEIPDPAKGSLRADARLPARDPFGARRCRQRRRHRQHAHRHAGAFVSTLMDLPNIKDIRLATKGLIAIPQHFLQTGGAGGLGAPGEKGARTRRRYRRAHPREQRKPGDAAGRQGRAGASRYGLSRCAQPGRAAARREHFAQEILDLCFMLLDHGKIMPYYFYQCDMIPNAEHWRLADPRSAAAPARHHGLPARLRHAAHGLRRALRRQALGPPGQGVRPPAGHFVLDEELPHRHRSR